MKGARRLLIILGAYIFNVALIIVIVVLEQWFSESTVRLPWAFTLVTSAVIVGTQIIFVIHIVRPPTL